MEKNTLEKVIRDRIIALIAGLSTLWVRMIFIFPDIDKAEQEVLA